MELLEILGKLADAGGMFLLALVALYWVRADAQRQVKDVKKQVIGAQEHAQQEREDKLLLIKTLQKNTQVLSELKVLVERLNGKS